MCIVSVLTTRKGVDVGCAELISDGKIGVKQGVEIEHLEADQVVFTDGSTIPADAVIFSCVSRTAGIRLANFSERFRTGYQGMRESIRTLMGHETIDRTSPVWGFDEEGEINGVCRPTGHPGVGLNFCISRQSK